jgi:GMP synthase (glutamine-hydrolysing)
MKNYFALEVEKIKQKVLADDCYVLGGISGGVDSSVCAALCQRALGSERFFPFLIDTGLMRYKEAEEVTARLTEHIPGLNLTVIDASEEFFTALKTETEPEKKRKIIGKLFIDQFEKAIRELNKYHPGKNIPIEKCYLLQGTLYPDVIESTSFKGPSSVIKSHHNVGGLPDRLPFKGLLEPLRMLFKDEVRQLGREAGLAEETLMRHPFPGPGLGIRIVGGEITRERADILRLADKIFLDELKAAKDEHGVSEYQKIAQAFATLMPTTKTVGVMGDARTYEMTCGLRAVETSDFMTADWYPMPYKLLGKVSNRIINEVRGINRVVYDVSSKPPATTEWE